MRDLARLELPLLVHAELFQDPGALARPQSYQDYLASRPPACEVRAVEMMIELSATTGCHVHIVHLSAAGALELVTRARAEGALISAETCPHYLYFAAEDVEDGRTQLKCTPPIRDRMNRDGLWRGLMDGEIDLIASDHSPCPLQMKALESGDFDKAWGGISSLGLQLPVVWTAGRERGIDLRQLADWLSTSPARMVGLDHKGAIAHGFDADMVVWDAEAHQIVQTDHLGYRHKHSPYAGSDLRGLVQHTYLRGRAVFRDGTVIDEPQGELLRRRG